MKRISFKFLSTLLAAVILVAALPIAAFAEDVSPCAVPPCDHSIFLIDTWYGYEWFSNEEHYKTLYIAKRCTECGQSESMGTGLPQKEGHEIDSSVDPEVDMQGLCSLCKSMIYW